MTHSSRVIKHLQIKIETRKPGFAGSKNLGFWAWETGFSSSVKSGLQSLIMAALHSICGHYIFVLWFLLSSICQLSHIGCLPYFHTWCGSGLSAYLVAGLKRTACGSLNIQDAKNHQNSPSMHHRTTLSSYIFATKARIDNRKKVVIQQYLPHMSLQYGEFQPTSAWDLLASLGYPSKFQRVSRLGSITARHSGSGLQPNFAALNRGSHLY